VSLAHGQRCFFVGWLRLKDEAADDCAEREKTTNAETSHCAQRNRVLRPINLQRNQYFADYAGCIAGSDVLDLPRLSRSRRRIAFNLPPRSKNKQVRYIHVSKMMIDASAR
jgi:hypothetical protein